MPYNASEFRTAWLEFVRATRPLLVPQPDDHPLDQYLPFRNEVLALVESEMFLAALGKASTPKPRQPEQDQVLNALLMELRAFHFAVEVAQQEEKAEKAHKGWLSRWLGRGSTITGSVSDLMKDLPPWAKQCLTLFKELLDIFKGE